MSNTNPLFYDKLTQVKTDPEFRERLKLMSNTTGQSASELMREAFNEKYARWAQARSRSRS